MIARRCGIFVARTTVFNGVRPGLARSRVPRLPAHILFRSLITDPAPSTVQNQAINDAEDSVARLREELEKLRESQEQSSGDGFFKSGGGKKGGSGGGGGGGKKSKHDWADSFFQMATSALTTFGSIVILAGFGYGYHRLYKYLVLRKIDNAFRPGDPALELAFQSKNFPKDGEAHWVDRDEQEYINRIISGDESGYYHLIIGEKGTGKSSMLLEAMAKDGGDRCSMVDAHADVEIFRLELGRALDFEYHEDNIGSLFSIRGPRDATPLLDIQRAFAKLEKVALRRRKDDGKDAKPLVLFINYAHLIGDNDDGRNLLEVIQLKAEKWAVTNLITVVFNSDDYWIYERLKNQASRMKVMSVSDLPRPAAIEALRRSRLNFCNEVPDVATCEEVYYKVGGRLSFLHRVARSADMVAECDAIIRAEKMWFLAQCGILGEEMDDDVMDQQKFASSAMVLAKEFADMEKEAGPYDPKVGHVLPQLPIDKARFVMTRADFLQEYDRRNIFTIDAGANVKADSVPMMHAFREVRNVDGFDDFLEATLDRISGIESLGRTKELEFKDLRKGIFQFFEKTEFKGGCPTRTTTFDVVPRPESKENEVD